jgi:hypothetical protein
LSDVVSDFKKWDCQEGLEEGIYYFRRMATMDGIWIELDDHARRAQNIVELLRIKWCQLRYSIKFY